MWATGFRPDYRWRHVPVVDPKGNQEESTFDPNGNPRTRTAPEPFSFTQTSEFDDRGNLKEFTDGRDKKWVYSYNEFNELISQRDPTQKTGYTYEYVAPSFLDGAVVDPDGGLFADRSAHRAPRVGRTAGVAPQDARPRG